MLQNGRVRMADRRVRLLHEESEAHETVGEAEVRQQADRLGAVRKMVDAGRAHAVLLRQLARGDRRPDRLDRGGMQGREMHDRAGVENAAEVGQAAFGRRPA